MYLATFTFKVRLFMYVLARVLQQLLEYTGKWVAKDTHKCVVKKHKFMFKFYNSIYFRINTHFNYSILFRSSLTVYEQFYGINLLIC